MWWWWWCGLGLITVAPPIFTGDDGFDHTQRFSKKQILIFLKTIFRLLAILDINKERHLN